MGNGRQSDQGSEGGGSSWYGRLRRLLKSEPASREDLQELLDDPKLGAILESEERTMLQGVLEVSETQVREVMVPRSQMVVLERDMSRQKLLEAIIGSGHSRFPVIGEDRDEVVGILLAKDLLRFFAEHPEGSLDLDECLRQPIYIPEAKRLNTLLKEFRSNRNHMAIVVDEYGGTAGLLTIEDVLEEIVGEIDDEHDPEEAEPIQKQEEGRYIVQALTRIDDFNDYFDANLDDDDDYDTIGGLVIHELGRLPRRGESMSQGGFRFKVLQADRRQVHSLEVAPEEPSASD